MVFQKMTTAGNILEVSKMGGGNAPSKIFTCDLFHHFPNLFQHHPPESMSSQLPMSYSWSRRLNDIILHFGAHTVFNLSASYKYKAVIISAES